VKRLISDASVIYVRGDSSFDSRSRPSRTGQGSVCGTQDQLPRRIFAENHDCFGFRCTIVYGPAREEVEVVQQSFGAFVQESSQGIQSHCERREKTIETAIADLQWNVAEESQINHVTVLEEDKCVIDHSQFLVGDEAVPEVPTACPMSMTE
jgi:hypothetical protein